MKYFSFGLITKHIWFILFMSLFDYLSFWTNYSLQRYNHRYTQLIYSFQVSFAQTLAIIFEIISLNLLRQKQSKTRVMLNKMPNVFAVSLTYENEFSSSGTKVKRAGNLIAIGLLNTLHIFIKELLYNRLGRYSLFAIDLNAVFLPYSIISMLSLVLTSVMCLFIFKTKIFRHHLLGLSLIIVFSCLSFGVFKFFEEGSITALFVVLVLSSASIQTILPIGQKWLMQNSFVSPYLILSCQGGIALAYSSIRITMAHEWPNVLFLLFTGNSEAVAFSYFNVLFYFGFFVCMIMTNMSYSPTHIYLSAGMAGMYCWFFSLISFIFNQNDVLTHFAFFFFFYPIWCFGCLIYNELVILKFCSLNVYTRREISSRAVLDANAEDEIKISD